MAKTVLLDLDDTILDFHKSEACALTQMLSGFGITATDEMKRTYSRINRSMWEQLELGQMSREMILVRRFELFFESIGKAEDSGKAKAAYEKALSGQVHFIDGAQELLEKISSVYELYIVSNGTAAVQDRRIAASGISRYFRDIFISEKIGYNKPDSAFFDYCFERIAGFDKSRCIIVGDSLTSDIAGGQGCGIATCRFNPNRTKNDGVIPDYEINSLSELPDVLMEFFG